jgi:3-oxoadipate enol-lactonase
MDTEMNSNGLEEKTLRKNGYDIHYYLKGHPESELIVFLHPAFGDHNCFYKQVDFFAKRYRVLTLDMVGHGQSQVQKSNVTVDVTAEHVVEIMALENHSTAHVVGVSMGALMAQDIAVKFPEKVKTVTAVGGYSIFGDNSEIQKAQSREMLKWLFLIIFSMKRFREYVTSVTVIHPQEREVFRKSMEFFTRSSFQVMSGMRKVLRKDEKVIHHPLLILVGDHDLVVAKKAAKVWNQAQVGSEFHTIPDAGHCANMDNAKEFNDILWRFVGKNKSK